MNYSTLTSLLQDYLQNSSAEFVAAIPQIVRLAEDRIYQSVQIPSLKKNATSTIIINQKYLQLPDDFLAPYQLAVIGQDGSYSYLLEREVGFIQEAFPVPTATGTPRYYARFSKDALILGPTPNAIRACELHYFYEPPSIVDEGTSWLGDHCESALLYGSLLEAYVYMKGEADMMSLYKARYDEALGQLKVLGEGYNKRDNFRADAPRMDPG